MGSFTVSAGDGVQEIKLDEKLFKPVKKLATPSDAGEEISTEVDVVTTEATTDVTTEEVTEAEEEENVVNVEPVAVLSQIMLAATNTYWVNG